MSPLFAMRSPSSPRGDDILLDAVTGSGVQYVRVDGPSRTTAPRVGGDARGANHQEEWPLYPFNPDSHETTPRNTALLLEVRAFMPDFDPAHDALAWKSLGELVRVWSRRSGEDMLKMTQDDTLATIRAYHAWSRGPREQPGRSSVHQESRKRDVGGARRPCGAVYRAGSVDTRLREFTGKNPHDAVELSLSELSIQLGCSKSAFSRSPFYRDHLRPRRLRRSRRAGGTERFDAEERVAAHVHDAAEAERDLIDERIDAEMKVRSRPS